MSKIKSEFHCIICNKNYASQSSLCNHKKRFHQSIQNNTSCLLTSEKVNLWSENGLKKSDNNNDKCMKEYNCRKCNKIYYNKQSRWSHEKICKNNNIILYDNKIEQLEKEIFELNL